MDPLSDVLRAVRLNGAFFYLVKAQAPWAVSKSAARALVPAILPESEHLISYHIVVSGSCWAGIVGETPVRLEVGDAIVFPHGDSHGLSSTRTIPSAHERMNVSETPYPATVFIGEPQDPETMIVCGFLGCDVRPYNPLLASMPRQMHVRGVFGGWLSQFPQQVVAESHFNRPGSETMLTRMAELMFVEVIRRQVEEMLPGDGGWLAGLADPVVGPALTRMHERPAHPWTLAELSREVAASRTVLVERFSEIIGIAPMQYLTRWRLQLAAEQLVTGAAKVAAIGERVGYDSEAAFSRAFKRATGVSPSEWRRTRRALTDGEAVARALNA